MGRPSFALAVAACFLMSISGRAQSAQYLGKFLGKLSELHHGVSGEVYAVDARTLHIKDFTYDGQGPAAYFFAGSSRAPGNTGFRIPDENGSPGVIRRYRKEGVTITLPEGKSLNNIKWFSVWCEEYEVNFGDVKIPKNFDYPRPQKIDGLRGVHAVSSDNIVIVDAQTLLVPSLSYDGEAPDAKFWVGRGPKPSPQGIRVPDENGKVIPLRRYDRKTVVLTLPGDLTVFDIGHFGIWCEAFTVDFGHVQIPPNPNIPPSLKMLGVSPQSKLNCEVLYDDLAFEVRWAIAGDSIVLQLVAKLENREYMSFGISGEADRSAMIGGDVVVAWVDKETLKGYAEDYYLEGKSQCSGPQGSCPDTRLGDNANNIRLLNAAMVNGYSIVTYQRPLRASDLYDKSIHTNQSQPVIFAIGPLNQRDEVSFHSQYNKQDKLIDFGRPAKWNCPMPEGDQPSMKGQPVQAAYVAETTTTTTAAPETVPSRGRNPETRRRGSTSSSSKQQESTRDSETRDRNGANRGRRRPTTTTTTTTTPRPVPTPAPVSKRDAWVIPPIECDEPEDGVFYAQLGPTGGKRGYPAITGHVGWGICWYINGLLIPEINVVRGQTYTFVVEGGDDPDFPAKYHPFYITDDAIGGYEYKTADEKKKVRIFAGARLDADGNARPTGVGRVCHWTLMGDSEADDFDSFGAYQRALELICDPGEPGFIQWTPDKDTPDTVYYQCFTHRYLGWKINVLDSCDRTRPAASEIDETVVEPDLEDSPSIRVETRVKANNLEEVVDKSNKDKPTNNDDDDSLEQLTGEIILDNQNVTEKKFEQQLPLVNAGVQFRITNNTVLVPLKKVPVLPLPPQKVFLRRPPRPLILMPNPQLVRRPPMIYKKPYYRPMPPKPQIIRPMFVPQPVKMPQPVIMPQPVKMPQSVKMRPQNVFIMKPQNIEQQQQYRKPEIKEEPTELHVEISQPQQSTEREPSSSLIYQQEVPSLNIMRPAVNTGFNPASVVIESGFKPIISKEIEHRMSDEGPEVQFESESGVVDESNKATEYFEPIFIPSPTLDTKKSLAKTSKKKVYYYPERRVVMDNVPMADERVESYYLPPDNRRTKPRNRSEAPPGTVITFDGKKVSGASLTARAGDTQRPIFDARSPRISELVRTRPQSVPYKGGDLPPLDFQVPQQARVLNRQLDTPPVKTIRRDREHGRRKREAHHTEEDTHQQQQQQQQQPNNGNQVAAFHYNVQIAAIFALALSLFNRFYGQ